MSKKQSFMKRLFSKNTVPTEPALIEDDKYEPIQIAAAITPERVYEAIRQAEGGDTRTLFTIYRDYVLSYSHVQAEFMKYKLAILSKPISVNPWDKDNPADVDAVDRFDRTLENTPGWIKSLAHLLDSALWPVSVAEKVFRVDGSRYRLDRIIPVPYHLLDFSQGHLMIREQNESGMPTEHLFDPDPNRYIIHRGNLLSMPDKFGGPMRSILFWILFALQDRDWWMKFLKRFGSPFIVGKYPAGDDNQRRLLQRVIQSAQRLFGMAVTNETSVEITETSQQSADSYDKFLAIANREISKLILGQTLSADAQPTGLGSGTSDFQSDVREDVRAMGSVLLAETIRDQLIKQIMVINSIPGEAPYILFGSSSEMDKKTLSELITSLRTAGLEPDDDAITTISDIAGFGLRRSSAPQDYNFQSAAFAASHLLSSVAGK
jgi:phage gp29-like protein